MTGKHYGRYVLESRIAMGGMAEIFSARTRTEGFEKRVCIKRILPHFLENEEFVTMFRDEARTAAKLQHANVVQVFDFGEEEGSLYLAMELVDGSDLRRLLETARKRHMQLDIGAAVQIAIDMCKGLHHAHTLTDSGKALGIVHRDISPHNVLLSKAGEVKVTDFGIARAAERATHTSTGMVKGKVAYMAPEQAQGLDFDHRLDQFATGVVLWEMLTGLRLFAGDNDILTLKKVLLCEVPTPSSIRRDVPAALDEIVLRALKEAPAERFADMRQLELALQRVLFSGAVDPATADVRLAFERIIGDQPAPARKTAVLDSDSVKQAMALSEPLAPPIQSLPPPAMTESHSGVNALAPGSPPSSDEARGGISVVFSRSDKALVAPGPANSGSQAQAPGGKPPPALERLFTEVEPHGPDPSARTVMEDDPRALEAVADPISRSARNAPAPGPAEVALAAPPADVTVTATPSARRAVVSSVEQPLQSVSELERLEEAARAGGGDGTPATRTAMPRAEPLPATLELLPERAVLPIAAAARAPGGPADQLPVATPRRRGRAAAGVAAALLATVLALVVFATRRQQAEDPGGNEAVAPPVAIVIPAVTPAAPTTGPAVVPDATAAPTPAPAEAQAPEVVKARPKPKAKVVDVLVRSPRYSGFLYVGGERFEVSPQGNIYRLPVGRLSARVQRGDGPSKAAQIVVEPGKPTLVTLE